MNQIKQDIRKIQEGSVTNTSPIIKKAYNLNNEMDMIKTIGKKVTGDRFMIDKVNYDQFVLGIQYFNRDPDFEKSGLSLGKGLLIAGGFGTGKTIYMKAFKEYCWYKKLKHQFRFEYAELIDQKFANFGFAGIQRYLKNEFLSSQGILQSTPINLCIDDLGVDKESAKYFGNEEFVMQKILSTRYILFQDGYITHATTNLDGKLLMEKYGKRIFSRIIEMFNFIQLGGEDRRK